MAMNRGWLKIQKHSPELLLGGGVITMIGGIAFTIIGTRKLDPILNEHQNRMVMIAKKAEEQQQLMEAGEVKEEEVVVADKELSKIKTVAYLTTTKDIIKAYAPAIGLYTLSLTCFLGSYGIINKRYTGLAASYTTLSTIFNKYRDRVKGKLGEEVERKIYLGEEEEVVEETRVNEKGKEIVEKKTNVYVNNLPSIFAKFFDKDNPNWDQNPGYSLSFLRAKESYWTTVLHQRGHVFLNEIYDDLGFEHTQEGAISGWVDGMGDGFVSFGLDNADDENVRRFVNGSVDAVLLDFNCDGAIWDYI